MGLFYEPEHRQRSLTDIFEECAHPVAAATLTLSASIIHIDCPTIHLNRANLPHSRDAAMLQYTQARVAPKGAREKINVDKNRSTAARDFDAALKPKHRTEHSITILEH